MARRSVSFDVRVLLLSLSISGALNTTLAQPAEARSVTYNLDIPAEKLGDALQAFALASGHKLLYSSKLVAGLNSVGLKGEYTTEEAMQQLLSGTNLVYKVTPDRLVVIGTASTRWSSANTGSATQDGLSRDDDQSKEKSLWDRFRLAEVDQGMPAKAAIAAGARENSDETLQKLEEVVVTAQKREERLIDVPISIVAITGDELQKNQLSTFEDLTSVVPGLSVTDTGSAREIFLRGVSNISGTSLVGMYIDEADVTLGGGGNAPTLNPGTYDLARVEVLRGPQGTLYGEGSAGGTIRFITNEPELTRFAFSADVVALFTQGGAPSQRINSMLNVPVLDGELGLRIAGTFDHEGGWIDQPVADLRNINGRDLTNVRIKGLWKPNSQFTVSAMAAINRDDRGLDITDPGSPRTFTQVLNLTTTPREKNDYDLYNLTLTYNLAAARLLSTSSYVESSIPVWNQSLSYQAGGAPGTPQSVYDFYIPLQLNKDNAFTQELRLTSDGSGVWQWTLGGFYRDYRNSNSAANEYFALPGPPGTALSTYGSSSFDTATSFKSWSVFGNTSYTLWDHLTVGAGVRYFRDRQNFSDFVAMGGERARFQSTDPRFYMQYKLDNNFNIYASASKGFRSGGFNTIGQAGPPTYGPESLWTYELGTKMLLVDSRVSADIAVFSTNYTDYQTTGLSAAGAFLGYTSNAGGARIKGIEWDLTWRPMDQWSLSVNGDYLDTRFTQNSANYNIGDPLDYSPKYQFILSGERDFTWNGKRGFVRLDYSEQGRAVLRYRSIGPWFHYQSDVIDLLNFHASLQWNDNLRVGLFAQNLLNDQSFVSPFWGLRNSIRPRPRTFGIEFGVAFK